jgi:hypothetical protein
VKPVERSLTISIARRHKYNRKMTIAMARELDWGCPLSFDCR